MVDSHTRECLAIEVDSWRLESAGDTPRRRNHCDSWRSLPADASWTHPDTRPAGRAYEDEGRELRGRLRDECLNAIWFPGWRRAAEDWRWWEDYNDQRPAVYWATCRYVCLLPPHRW